MRLLTFIMLFMLSFASRAQSDEIFGRVTDQTGTPLVSATIAFKGLTAGATKTNSKGIYRTTLPKGYDSIVCTYVGFVRTAEKVSGNNEINFRLAPSAMVTSLSIDTVYFTEKADRGVLKKPPSVKSDFRIFEKVEINATYPGGDNALKKYLANRIVYPESELGIQVKGVVEVGFYITEDGKASDLQIIKGVNPTANELVLEAIQSIPKWICAIQNGTPVKQLKIIQVSFDIERK